MITNSGVNLGGWFIPEKWMTPNVFEGNEHDTAALLSSKTGKIRYQQHIKTFITKKDIFWLVSHNVQFVRLPVAWWMLDDTHEMSAVCLERLDWFMKQAEKAKINVLLDMHGLKGSQNGKDHSGEIGKIKWQKYCKQNVQCIKHMALRYKDSPSLWGIELVNEPILIRRYLSLQKLYRLLIRQLDKRLASRINIVIHDGFHPFLSARFFDNKRVILDIHLYEIPLKQSDTLATYLDRRDRMYARRIKLLSHIQPVLVGEWSGVLPERLLQKLSPEYKASAVKDNVQRQLAIYQNSTGCAFWSYTASDTLMWSFQTIL